MRITLEHTDILPGEDTRRVTIEIGRDDIALNKMWADLIKPALLGMTYTENAVDEWIDEFKTDECDPDDDAVYCDSIFDHLVRQGGKP